MRLVDADKQLEWVDCMKPIHGIGLEPVVAVETVRDLIKGAATIDAIPVEWLEAQIRPYTGDVSDIGKSAKNGTIKSIIRKWQKEQEAQECSGI